MEAVMTARAALLAAREAVKERSLALGHAIADARAAGNDQVQIARTLGLTRESVRRFEAEWRESQG